MRSHPPAWPAMAGRVFSLLQFLEQLQLIYFPPRHPWPNSVRRDRTQGACSGSPRSCAFAGTPAGAAGCRREPAEPSPVLASVLWGVQWQRVPSEV